MQTCITIWQHHSPSLHCALQQHCRVLQGFYICPCSAASISPCTAASICPCTTASIFTARLLIYTAHHVWSGTYLLQLSCMTQQARPRYSQQLYTSEAVDLHNWLFMVRSLFAAALLHDTASSSHIQHPCLVVCVLQLSCMTQQAHPTYSGCTDRMLG